MNSRTEFLENIFSPKYDYSKVFYYKTCRNEKFSIQNLTFWKFFFSNFHCAGKRLLQNLITFFLKISFQTLIFKEKVYFKIMPFKKSTKNEKLVVFPGTNWVRTFFFRCEFLIEIWFLNKNWTQKLSFWKIFFLQNMIIRKFFIIKLAGTKSSQFKTWHFGNFSFQIFIVQENVCFRIWLLFFWKFLFKLWFSMKKFATKSCLLKWARRVKTMLFFPEQIESERFFSDLNFWSKSDFSINIELKNWVSGQYSFSRIWLFEKFFIIKSAGMKNSQFTIWNFEKMSFQNLIL